MAFLYEKIDALREAGFSEEVPAVIKDNINQNFELRPYQALAFENFIMYFGNKKLCQKPTQVLFHMATGSGKTYMACALGMEACKQYYTVQYVRLPDLLLDLQAARDNGNFPAVAWTSQVNSCVPLQCQTDKWGLPP